MKSILVVIAGLSLVFTACAGREERPATASTPVPRTSTPDRSGASNPTIAVAHGGSGGPAAASPASVGQGTAGGSQTAGGLSWKSPTRWSTGPERPMRAATYKVPAAAGDAEDGECAVFFFGPGQGGGVDANIDRWVGQFEQPDGQSSSERAKRQTQTVGGMSVTTVDLTGTYTGGMMGGGGGKKPGYRLLGAIAEGPQAGVFFKLTGPVRTVGAAEAEFQTMLKSLRK